MPATERSTANNPIYPPTTDALGSNPLIQQMVEERMAVLEAKMKLEIQGGMQRWPNESCVIGTARKRVTLD